MGIREMQDRSLFFGSFPDPDHSLVEASKAGDVTAFQRLTEGYRPRLSRLAQRITKNREDAEDAMQETFLQTFRHLSAFRGDAHFFFWLRRIAVNESLILIRRNRVKHCSFDELLLQPDNESRTVNRQLTPEQTFRQREFLESTLSLVDKLRPDLRVALRMHAIEELSVEEIALTLGLSISTVKTRIHRARMQLRKAMRVHGTKTRALGQTPLRRLYLSR